MGDRAPKLCNFTNVRNVEQETSLGHSNKLYCNLLIINASASQGKYYLW